MDFELKPVEPPSGSGSTVPAVQIHGDVDAANATDLGNALRDLAIPALIIDLSHMGYFDSAGFAMIDRLLDEIQVVVVISPDCVIRPAAELVNLPFYDNVADARKSMEPALTLAAQLVLSSVHRQGARLRRGTGDCYVATPWCSGRVRGIRRRSGSQVIVGRQPSVQWRERNRSSG